MMFNGTAPSMFSLLECPMACTNKYVMCPRHKDQNCPTQLTARTTTARGDQKWTVSRTDS
jgi:hypothetical protein